VLLASGGAETTSFKQLQRHAAVGLGSKMLDRAFQRLVEKRLEGCPDVSFPQRLAWKLSRARGFRSIKTAFKRPFAQTEHYVINLGNLELGISQNTTSPSAGIERGRMHFSK
jgi:hypothetical protein